MVRLRTPVVVCDQVYQVAPVHQVNKVDEVHQVDPVHQVNKVDDVHQVHPVDPVQQKQAKSAKKCGIIPTACKATNFVTASTFFPS